MHKHVDVETNFDEHLNEFNDRVCTVMDSIVHRGGTITGLIRTVGTRGVTPVPRFTIFYREAPRGWIIPRAETASEGSR